MTTTNQARMNVSPKPGRINLSPRDAAIRIAGFEETLDSLNAELEAFLRLYELPRLAFPQLCTSKRLLKHISQHMALAGEVCEREVKH